MTWVIGAASILSSGAIISDIRVRFKNGHSADILQKAYPVGNYIAAGFAGSVNIGFQLIQNLKDSMALSGCKERDYAFDPAQVAHTWSTRAREIFTHADEEEKRNGAQIILVGVSPTENLGVAEFPRIYLIRFTAPHFVPGFIERGLRMCSIGSGAGVNQYKQSLRPLLRLGSGIHQANMSGVHEWAKTLAFSTTVAVRDFPYAGISENFHVVGIRFGEMVVVTNDMVTYPTDEPPLELRMPSVAHSWQEFCDMAKSLSTASMGAIC
jgi:hypothetical protein